MPKILVTDDNEDIRFLIEINLMVGGYQVITAQTGFDALLQIDQNPDVALVILDVQMPEMDGWETLKRIRSHRQRGDLPVVLCTVKSSTEDKHLGWTLGCDAFLTKPFETDYLVSLVKEVLDRSPMERNLARSGAIAAAAEQ